MGARVIFSTLMLTRSPSNAPPPRQRPREMLESMRHWLRTAAQPGGLAGIAWGLLLVVAVTVILTIIKHLIELPPIVITYPIPMRIAASSFGFLARLDTTAGRACCP